MVSELSCSRFQSGWALPKTLRLLFYRCLLVALSLCSTSIIVDIRLRASDSAFLGLVVLGLVASTRRLAFLSNILPQSYQHITWHQQQMHGHNNTVTQTTAMQRNHPWTCRLMTTGQNTLQKLTVQWQHQDYVQWQLQDYVQAQLQDYVNMQIQYYVNSFMT